MDELARQPKHGPHYAQLLHLLNEMQNHQSAWPFQKPVNPEEVPDYYNVITEPMDLETMEKRLEEDAYSTPEEFIRDAKLVFNNCRRYNNETTSYWKNANKLEKFMKAKLAEIPEWSVRVSFLWDMLFWRITYSSNTASCRLTGECWYFSVGVVERLWSARVAYVFLQRSGVKAGIEQRISVALSWSFVSWSLS